MSDIASNTAASSSSTGGDVNGGGGGAAQLWRIAAPIYLPAVLFGVGQGAVAPVIALSARELGASVGVAGFVVALVGIGQLFGDLPAGAFAARVGERRAMILAVLLVAAAMLMCVGATSVWMLGAAIAVMGLASAVWGIARHAYLTEVVPYPLRARAMSTLGGTHRIGMFVGPFLGAGAMSWWGTDGAYWVHLAAAVIAAALLAALPEPARRGAPGEPPSEPPSEHGRRQDVADSAGSGAGAAVGDGTRGTLHILRDYLPVFRTLGVGVLLVGAIRASRQAVIPLWADHIGLDPSTTSIIFGVAGAVDMALFYPAGKAMDRFGRVWVGVGCMLVMAFAHVLLPLTHAASTLLTAAVVLGFGNGMGSGIIMTLGADASPAVGRPKFLGGWRLCADLGNASGPLLISGITTLFALAPAVLAMTGVGVAGAAALARWIPRHRTRDQTLHTN